MAKTFLDAIKALASIAGGAGFNLGVGTAPSSPSNGDVWNTSTGMFVRTNGATIQLGTGGTPLGRFIDNFTLTTGDTSKTLTHTPASQVDIIPSTGPILLDPAQITGLSGKVVTFNSVPTSMNGKTLSLEYTRID